MTTDHEPADSTVRAGRPVVALDVDGVLAPDPARIVGHTEALAALGYRKHAFDDHGPDGMPASGVVWLHPEHGPWLRELLDLGAELVWATSWNHVAASWIAPRLDLPAFPVLDVPRTGPRFGRSPKLDVLTRWAGDRPLAWVDDELGGKEPGWAEDRRDDGFPTLIVQPDSGRGLERRHIDKIVRWLSRGRSVAPRSSEMARRGGG